MTHYQSALQVHCSLSLSVPVDGPEDHSQERSAQSLSFGAHCGLLLRIMLHQLNKLTHPYTRTYIRHQESTQLFSNS